jgi:hypothetical protein
METTEFPLIDMQTRVTIEDMNKWNQYFLRHGDDLAVLDQI